MRLTLNIWRQKNALTAGKMVRYEMKDIDGDMSILEALDGLNVLLEQRLDV